MSVDIGTLLRTFALRHQLIFGTVNAGPGAFRATVAALGDHARRWPKEIGRLITSFSPLGEMAGVLSAGPLGTKWGVEVA